MCWPLELLISSCTQCADNSTSLRLSKSPAYFSVVLRALLVKVKALITERMSLFLQHIQPNGSTKEITPGYEKSFRNPETPHFKKKGTRT